MGWGRVAETELMPRLVGDYTEPSGSKLKRGKEKEKPTSESGLNPKTGSGDRLNASDQANFYFDRPILGKSRRSM